MTTNRVVFRFSISRTIATCAICILIGIAATMSDVSVFLCAPAFMIVIGIPFFLLLGLYGQRFLSFIPISILTLFCKPSNPMPLFSIIAHHGSRYTLASGVIGMLIGLVQFLSGISDPKSIGEGFAMLLLTVLYAVIVAELFFAMVEQSFQADIPQSTSTSRTGLMIVVGVVTGVVMLIAVFILAFISIDISSQQHSSAPSTCTLDLDPFKVNIADTDNTMILSFTPYIEADEHTCYLLIKNHALLRDRIGSIAGSTSLESLSDIRGKEHLKQRIHDTIKEIIKDTPIAIDDIYFTDYLIYHQPESPRPQYD